MKCKIREQNVPQTFVPGEITISFETEEELSYLLALFNSHPSKIQQNSHVDNTPFFDGSVNSKSGVYEELKKYAKKHTNWHFEY